MAFAPHECKVYPHHDRQTRQPSEGLEPTPPAEWFYQGNGQEEESKHGALLVITQNVRGWGDPRRMPISGSTD